MSRVAVSDLFGGVPLVALLGGVKADEIPSQDSLLSFSEDDVVDVLDEALLHARLF